VKGMVREVKDVIWMIWKNDQGEPFKVGELSKTLEKYYFKYDIDGVKKAQVYGFTPLQYLPKVDVEYFREELFSSFSKRLSFHGKKEITSILKEYHLQEYDAFELLKKGGGKMSTDSLEFIVPYDEECVASDLK